MPVKLQTTIALIVLSCVVHFWTTGSALAITADVAKKCGASVDKTYPLRVTGNPAAGRVNGSEKAIRDYFNKCVANVANSQAATPDQPNAQIPLQATKDTSTVPLTTTEPHYRYSQRAYASCDCRYGFSSTASTCEPETSCYAQGGHCTKNCRP